MLEDKMGYTKVIGTYAKNNLTEDLGAAVKNPKFSIDLKLVVGRCGAPYYIMLVVKHNRRKQARNLSVYCNGVKLIDGPQADPYWETVEIPLGFATRLANGQYRFDVGVSLYNWLPIRLWYTRLNNFRISVTSCGNGNLFTANIAEFLNDVGKGKVKFYYFTDNK